MMTLLLERTNYIFMLAIILKSKAWMLLSQISLMSYPSVLGLVRRGNITMYLSLFLHFHIQRIVEVDQLLFIEEIIHSVDAING